MRRSPGPSLCRTTSTHSRSGFYPATGNLDSKTSAEILDVLRESVESYGQTTVMVTHDPGAAAIGHRTLFLADGLIVKELRGASAHDLIAAVEEISAP